jgi:hypothetical protein
MAPQSKVTVPLNAKKTAAPGVSPGLVPYTDACQEPFAPPGFEWRGLAHAAPVLVIESPGRVRPDRNLFPAAA